MIHATNAATITGVMGQPREIDARLKVTFTLCCMAGIVASIFGVASHVERLLSTRYDAADLIASHESIGGIRQLTREHREAPTTPAPQPAESNAGPTISQSDWLAIAYRDVAPYSFFDASNYTANSAPRPATVSLSAQKTPPEVDRARTATSIAHTSVTPSSAQDSDAIASSPSQIASSASTSVPMNATTPAPPAQNNDDAYARHGAHTVAIVTPPVVDESRFVEPRATTHFATLRRTDTGALPGDLDPATLIRRGKDLAGQTVSFVVSGQISLDAGSKNTNHLELASYAGIDPHIDRAMLEKWLRLDRDDAEDGRIRITGVVRADGTGDRVVVDVTDMAMAQ